MMKIKGFRYFTCPAAGLILSLTTTKNKIKSKLIIPNRRCVYEKVSAERPGALCFQFRARQSGTNKASEHGGG